MFGKHKAPREIQLALWSTNEIFGIMLTSNSTKYSHCIRNNAFCVNVRVCLFHQIRIKKKNLEPIKLWGALESEGTKPGCCWVAGSNYWFKKDVIVKISIKTHATVIWTVRNKGQE